MMSWLRQNWRWLLTGFALVFVSILVVWLIIVRNKREAEALKLEIERLKMTTKLAGLEQDRKARAAELSKNDLEAKRVDKEISDLQAQLVETHQPVPKDATPEDVAAEFEKLGY